MKIGVMGAGRFMLTSFIKKELSSCDYLIAVDGGLDHFRSIDLVPDEVIGDFDSMTEKAKIWLDREHIYYTQYPTKKDKTDSALAISRAIEQGADEILMLGLIGSRADHSLANILLLDDLQKRGMKAKIVDAQNVIMLVTDEMEIIKGEFSDFKYVSVIPLSENATLDLIGFQYEVQGLKMNFGANEGMGLSNEIVSERASIRLHHPNERVLVIISKD